MLEIITAGDSHGPGLNLIINGFPRDLKFDRQSLEQDLKQRRSGFGRSGRMKIEQDAAEILSGIRKGKTTGNPISIIVPNNDYENWQEHTCPEENLITNESPSMSRPRPGHVDLAACQKFLTKDARDAVERASARSSVPYVIAGNLAKQFLINFNIDVVGYVKSIGPITASNNDYSLPVLRKIVEASSLRCSDEQATSKMCELIEKTKKNGDTLGGIIEIRSQGLCPGLGSFNQWFEKLDSKIAAAIIGIPAVKGVEFGDGFLLSQKLGSDTHDVVTTERTNGMFPRASNNAGGIEGGLSNGAELMVRAVMKPLPTLGKPLNTIDLATKNNAKANTLRTDTCAVPACALICESMIAWTLANSFLQRFGGITMNEISEHYQAYQQALNQL
ncbi:MAG: chorismate synthase [Myxococcales bacterium]|nr:chorismate synthase [Myxococcales bacterium]|tara:strand:- start:129 stop:1295 length:1167 start_codon:yes stop_codon:yes gene_type:complete